MKLSKDNVIDLVKKPANGDLVNEGRKYESRLRLFTEPKFKKDAEAEEAFKEFKASLNKTIGLDKSARIQNFIEYPLSVVSITNSLTKDLYKVFDAGNSFFGVEATNKDAGDKIKKIIDESDPVKWIETVGKKVLKNKPNTAVVVDKDEDGKPYMLAVYNDRIVDISISEDGFSCDYIIFKHSEVINKDTEEKEIRYSAYSDEAYFVVLQINDRYEIETESSHDIGYCPARMFIKNPLNSDNEFTRESQLINQYSKIVEYQKFDVFKFYTDHYAPFPVTEMVRPTCGNDNCSNGFIEKITPYKADGETKELKEYVECGTCAESANIKIGAKILIDPPRGDGDKTAAGIFRMISNDIENLKYLGEKQDKIAEEIKLRVVGQDNSVQKEAVNEMQVKGGVQSKENVLLDTKENMDGVYTWIAETISKSVNKNKSIVINSNFGTEWYLMSEDDLQRRYDNAKKIGLPAYEIEQIYHQLIETKYKGNPDRLRRMKVINAIDPLPYQDIEGKIRMSELGLITREELLISSRIDTFVKRFEIEEGLISDFGSEMEQLKDRYKKIRDILIRYANESNTKQPEGSQGEA